MPHMFRRHTLLHKARHKYAFSLCWCRKHIKCHFFIFSSHFHWQLCGRHTQQEVRDNQFYEELMCVCNPFHLSERRQKDDKCWSGWREVIQWSCTERRWDSHRMEEWGREGCFFHPSLFTPVATATCLQGTQKEASSPTRKTKNSNREAKREWEQTQQTSGVARNEFTGGPPNLTQFAKFVLFLFMKWRLEQCLLVCHPGCLRVIPISFSFWPKKQQRQKRMTVKIKFLWAI